MPTDYLNQFTDSVNQILGSEIVHFTILIAGGYLVVLWLAAAFWAFRDMHERTENLLLPYLGAGLIILFSPLFFVFGVVVYRIVRPAERLGEVYERNLAEEAMLAEVETIRSCRGCGRRVNEEWIICPSCRTRLNRVCPNCERLVGLDWSLCAWCGKDFERPIAAVVDRAPMPVADTVAPEPRPQPLARRAAGASATGGPVAGR